MILLAAGLVLAGCLSLALSQQWHWQAVAGSLPAGRVRAAVRVAGWASLAVALGVCMEAEGPGFALLIWTLQVALASFVVAMTLSFSPGVLKPVVRTCSRLWP